MEFYDKSLVLQIPPPCVKKCKIFELDVHWINIKSNSLLVECYCIIVVSVLLNHGSMPALVIVIHNCEKSNPNT